MQQIKRWLLALAAVFSTAAALSAERPMRRDGDLKVGDAAPDFTISDIEGKRTVQLAKLKGKPVVLIFGSCT